MDTKHLTYGILGIFVLLTIFGGIQTYHLWQQPIVLDYFYNPILQMWEPVEIERDYGWLNVLMVPVAFATWVVGISALWFRMLYLTLVVWLGVSYVVSQYKGYQFNLLVPK